MDSPGRTLLAPKAAETSLEIPLGAPESRSGDLFVGPGGLQERSRRPIGGQDKGTERATRAKRPPRRVRGPFRTHFGYHFGIILGTSWSYSGISLRAVFASQSPLRILSKSQNPGATVISFRAWGSSTNSQKALDTCARG